MTSRAAGGPSTGNGSERRGGGGGGGATSPPVMRLQNMRTVFERKTLFDLPLAMDRTSSRPRHHHHHHPCSALMTFPLDENHLLVTCDSEKSPRDGASTVFVVHLRDNGPPTSTRCRLPIAAISGCVRDHSVSARKVAARTTAAGGQRPAGQMSLTKEKDGEDSSVHTIVVTNSVAHSRSSSKNTSALGLSSRPKSEGEESAKPEENTLQVEQPIKIVPGSSVKTHSFLVADAALHAIWAMEVDTESLEARVVSSHGYRGKQLEDEDAIAQTQRQRINHAANPRPLLGGIAGFVDGPFHAARFASPSALCWRIDAGVNMDSGQQDERAATSRCDVLFVSDIGNHAIRYVNFRSRLVRTVSGLDGVPGYRDGAFRASRLQEAAALAWCSAGLLFVDGPNGALRLITGLEKAKTAEANKERVREAESEAEAVAPPSSCIFSPSVEKSVEEAVEEGRDEEGRDEGEKEKGCRETTARRAPRVWTIAGGLHGGAGPYIDAEDVRQASLGVPSALAVLPGGGGVVFVDSQHAALRVLSRHGVETLVEPCSSVDSSATSAGLVGCTHMAVCHVYTPGAVPRVAFLVSSGLRQSVSLLLLLQCSDGEGEGSDGRLELDSSGKVSIAAAPATAECVQLENGILHKYTRLDGRAAAHDATTAPVNVSRCHKRPNAQKGSRGSGGGGGRRSAGHVAIGSVTTAPTRGRLSLRRTVLTGATMSQRLKDAVRRLFGVYAHYASRSAAPHLLSNLWTSATGSLTGALDAAYSLSLLSFWRFLTHAEYFSAFIPLSFTPNVMQSAVPAFKSSEQGDFVRLSLHDWRAVTEVLHGLSVKRHGYHVCATMSFSFFCRVVLFLYSWKHRKRSLCEGGDSMEWCDPRQLLFASLNTLGEGHFIAAYEDAVQRVETANVHLHRATSASKEKQQQQEYQTEESDRFLAVDEVLRLLVRNEKQFLQLFNAYSTTAAMSHRPSSSSADRERVTALCQLHQATFAGDSGEEAWVAWTSAVLYNRFHALFHAVNVFPTLINESLLQRAFVDALLTPLFHRLRREKPRAEQQQQQQEQSSHHQQKPYNPSVITPISHDVERAYAGGGTALPFLPFVEAFTRVALTTFSLCSDSDRAMYPTAAAKVEALMWWVNRAVSMGLTREREPVIRGRDGHSGPRNARSCNDGGGRKASSRLAYPTPTQTPFPFDFVGFDVTTQALAPV